MLLLSIFGDNITGSALSNYSAGGVTLYELREILKSKWNVSSIAIALDGGGSTQIQYKVNNSINYQVVNDSSNYNTSIDLVTVNSDERIYKIRITIDGTMYYLTAGSKTSTAYATWETASGDEDQEWQFEEIVLIDLPSDRIYNWNQFYQGVYNKIQSDEGCSWTCALDVANIYGPDPYEPADMPDNAWDGRCHWHLPHNIEDKEDCIGSINDYTPNLLGENCLPMIYSELDNNRPVIIELSDGSEQHFVVAYGYIKSGTENTDIMVFDPGVKSETASRNQKNGIIWTLFEAENLISKYINRIRTTSGR